jgi:hypothetical protein
MNRGVGWGRSPMQRLPSAWMPSRRMLSRRDALTLTSKRAPRTARPRTNHPIALLSSAVNQLGANSIAAREQRFERYAQSEPSDLSSPPPISRALRTNSITLPCATSFVRLHPEVFWVSFHALTLIMCVFLWTRYRNPHCFDVLGSKGGE